MSRIWSKIVTFLEMIKVSHTVFALPFAIGATFLAARGAPDLYLLGQVVLAVLCARTAAMSFNRIVDRRFDSENPRTANRALVTGALSLKFVGISTAVSVAGFFAVAWWINPLAFALSPIAVAVLLAYSMAKRFTRLCHLILGAALALAPMGAWVAVRGELGWEPYVLGAAVLLWTAGFDIIYACLDIAFDRSVGLRSIPATLGVKRALRISGFLHAGMLLALGFLAWFAPALGVLFVAALGIVALLLIYEHRLISADDLTRANKAFFTMNGVISFLLMAAMIVETTWPR